MKKLLLFSFILVFVGTAFSQIPSKNLTIMEIQQVPQDSLVKMETLQTGTASNLLDNSKYVGDTVTITGVVMVKPRILTYTLARYNIFIQDTASKTWAGINVLTNDTSAQAQSTLITALDSGYVVTVTGRVLEYSSTGNGLTEMYIYNNSTDATGFPTPVPANILGVGKRPEAVELNVSDFAIGALPPNGKVKYSIGEQYESMYVIIKNVTVSSVDWATGRFNFIDAQGNEMQMYDGSGYYTLRGHKTSGSKYSPPAVGTKLAYIRGIILPMNNNIYTIMPLYPGKDQLSSSTYPGDIKVDKYSPDITNISRNPLVVTPNDNVLVKASIKDLNTGGAIDSAFFCYKVGTNPLTIVKLAKGDTSYTIPKQAEGTPVQYFFVAYNALGLKGMAPDTGKSWGFYISKSTGLTIYDLQYTPFIDGNSPYMGATVTVNGTVTSDTSDTPGSTLVFMQSGTGPWSGINLYGSGTAAAIYRAVKRGDSIAATGVVTEYSGKTELVVTAITTIAQNKTVPEPSVVSISGSGSFSYALSNPPVNGTQIFEKWEGVLVKFNNVYINNLAADAPSHYGEFFVCSTPTSAYGVRVNDCGSYPYYTDTEVYSHAWKTLSPANLLPLGTKIASLIGVIDYTNSNYKLEPRKADDFIGIKTSVETLSNLPEAYSLSQNYPNPFNPSTTIQYSIQKAGNVTLKLYNTLGQEVLKVVDQFHNAGKYQVNVDASKLSSGIYFYTLKTSDFVKSMKMVLVK